MQTNPVEQFIEAFKKMPEKYNEKEYYTTASEVSLEHSQVKCIIKRKDDPFFLGVGVDLNEIYTHPDLPSLADAYYCDLYINLTE